MDRLGLGLQTAPLKDHTEILEWLSLSLYSCKVVGVGYFCPVLSPGGVYLEKFRGLPR